MISRIFEISSLLIKPLNFRKIDFNFFISYSNSNFVKILGIVGIVVLSDSS
jgi:hypothetical protein